MFITSGGLRSTARFDRAGGEFKTLLQKISAKSKLGISEIAVVKDLKLTYEFRYQSDASREWKKLSIHVPAGSSVSMFPSTNKLYGGADSKYDSNHFMINNARIEDPDSVLGFRPCHIIFNLHAGRFEIRHLDGVSSGANPMGPLSKIGR